MFVFFIGMSINLHSDHVLRRFRKPSETGYKIPQSGMHSGMFRWISVPKFFGEVVEWFGFAIADWSWPELTFAITPRALQHHAWYLERFGDEYPSRRRAFIPGVL